MSVSFEDHLLERLEAETEFYSIRFRGWELLDVLVELRRLSEQAGQQTSTLDRAAEVVREKASSLTDVHPDHPLFRMRSILSAAVVQRSRAACHYSNLALQVMLAVLTHFHGSNGA